VVRRQACNQEQALIIIDTVKAENEKMEEIANAQDENIAHEGQKSPYPKRSNVVGLWKKREEAIKATNLKLKERAREIEFEEKKEANQEIEDYQSPTLPHDSKTVGSERTALEPTSEKNVEGKGSTVNAPRRSNIRDSWKKRAANSPSTQFPNSSPTPNVDKTAEIMISASDSMVYSQSKSSGKILSSTEKSPAPVYNRIPESPSNASTSAFDELKSKWAKFGVQNENNPIAEGDRNQTAESEVKDKIVEPPLSPSNSKIDSTEKESTTSGGSSYSARALAARRMGSKRFRSKYARKPLTASTSSTDETMGVTKNASADLVVSENKVEQSSDPFSPSIEKEWVAAFPADESIQNETDSHSNMKADDNAREVENNLFHSPVSTEKTKDSIQSPESTSKEASTPPINISMSSLSSRANQRLRDIRMRNQNRKEEANTESASGTSSPIRRAKTHDQYGSTPMPMDESMAFSKSLTDVKSDDQRSPLHAVVPDINKMIPDGFVSENNSNVESFKTAFDNTSFGQIAKDMSSMIDVDMINEGVHSALNSLGFADLFQTKSPRKVSKRAPSPVEEVAIEVEYLADTN